ncbi:MAG: DUF4893 domain-containing protein [Sulfitobacter sp.]
MRKTLRAASPFLLAFLPSVPALAGPPALSDMRPHDAAKLDRFETTAGAALLEAFAAGSAPDRSALATALSGTPIVAYDPSIVGDWSCRTIKLGGLTGLTAYSPFSCRITLSETGYVFEKLTGSQRTAGRLGLRDGRAVYLGVGFVADTAPPDYTALEPGFTGNGTIAPQVGLFERVSDSRARILFPQPAVESDLDILELTR